MKSLKAFVFVAVAGAMSACGFLNSKPAKPANVAEVIKTDNSFKNAAVKPGKIAVSQINFRVATKLERLTLVSGEGHMAKKVMSGLLAGALSVAGIGGVDTAGLEPLKEHLKPEDAKFLSDEFAKIVSEKFQPAGVTVIPAKSVAGAGFYQNVDGDKEMKDKVYRDNKNKIAWGTYYVPTDGLKYSESATREAYDKEISPAARKELGADATVGFTFGMSNDKKFLRLEDFRVTVWAQPKNYPPFGPAKNADIAFFHARCEKPGKIGVPTGNEDIRSAWKELKPVVESMVAEASSRFQSSL